MLTFDLFGPRHGAAKFHVEIKKVFTAYSFALLSITMDILSTKNRITHFIHLQIVYNLSFVDVICQITIIIFTLILSKYS